MFLKKISSANASVFKYPSPEKGDLYCLLSVDSFSGGNSERLMKMVWDGVVDEYTYTDAGPLESLKLALKAGEKKLRSLLQNDDNFEESGVGLSITVFVVRGNNLYLGNLGENGADLWREDKYISISEILKSHNVVAGSAMIEDTDILLVSTRDIHDELVKNSYSYDDIIEFEQDIEAGGLVLISKQEQIAKIIEIDKDLEVEAIIEEHKGNNLVESQMLEDAYSQEPVIEEVVGYQGYTEPIEFPENGIVEEQKLETIIENESTNIADLDGIHVYSDIKDVNDSDERVSESFENSTDELEDYPVEMSIIPEVKKRIPMQMKDEDLRFTPRIHGIPIRDEPAQFEVEDTEDKQYYEEIVDDGSLVSKARRLLRIVTEKSAIAFKYAKKKMPFVITAFNKVINFIGIVSTKITFFLGSKLGGVFTKIKKFFDDKYGHEFWYRKFTARLTQTKIPLLSKGNDTRGMRIDGYKITETRNKRIGMALVIILVMVLGFFGYKYSQQVKLENEVHATVLVNIKNATTYLEAATRDSKTNSASAAANITKAKVEIANANKVVLKQEDKTKLNDLTSQIQGIEDIAYKRFVVSEAANNIEIYMDTKLTIGEKSSPTDLTLYRNDAGNEFLVIADTGEKGIYRISLYDKAMNKIPDASGKITSPKFVEVGMSGIYVFDNNSGIVRSSFEAGSFKDFISLTGLSALNLGTDNIVGMAIYTSNDNAYLIDKKQGGILKAVQTDDGVYALPIKYVDDKALNQGTDLFADDNIYYTFLGGQGLKKSFAGQVVTTSITGVVPAGGSYTAGFAWDTIDKKLFVFDKDNKRVLVFERPDEAKNLHPGELVLVKQIVYRGDKSDVFTNVKDIAVSFNDKELYVLDGLRVWKIKM